jgi:hypothetical protein
LSELHSSNSSLQLQQTDAMYSSRTNEPGTGHSSMQLQHVATIPAVKFTGNQASLMLCCCAAPCCACTRCGSSTSCSRRHNG